MTENFDRAKTWLKKLREIRFSVGHISWPFNLDLMLYLCSGQNDLVHQYECSVLSNDKSTVINLCRKMTVTYYYITHQVTSAGLTIMHLEYSNVLSPYPTPHPSPYPSEIVIWNETSVHIHEVALEFQNIFFYFQYFMFVILQLFNIILIYMGAVECLKEKAEHECIYYYY